MARRAKQDTDKPPATPQPPPLATFHPLSEIFPLMQGAEFDALVADIKTHGLIEPIVEADHQILDGRNRYRACLAAGVEPRFEPFTGKDIVAYVISKNLQRRHLDEGQRGIVAARLANLRQGVKAGTRPANLPVSTAVTQTSAAELLNVSPRTIRDARVVLDRAVPELVERVERGEVAVSVAAKVAALPEADQRAVARATEPEVRAAAKRHARAQREVALAERTEKASEALGSQLYSVILADPPWRFEPRSRVTGMDRAADNHYPTMTVERLKELTPPAADDCVLFLWATAPMLREALDVMQAWGFDYKTHCIWSKDRVGTGYWFRSCHELLLVGVKGNIPAPAPGDQYASVIEARVGEHSEKPIQFHEMIDDLFPSAPRLEMFAREAKAGWHSWGNEVEPTGTVSGRASKVTEAAE